MHTEPRSRVDRRCGGGAESIINSNKDLCELERRSVFFSLYFSSRAAVWCLAACGEGLAKVHTYKYGICAVYKRRRRACNRVAVVVSPF